MTALLGAIALFLCPALSLAHPIHSSLAEADYDRETEKLEVALRVFADDFEAALSARAKKKISLEKTPAAELEALIRAYVAETFTVKARDGSTGAHQWIGRDLKDAANELWLFFEVTVRGGIDGAKLRHGVLADHFSDQLNTVQLRDDQGRKLSLVFLPTHAEKVVRFRPEVDAAERLKN